MPASSFNMTRGLASPSPSPQPTPSVDMLVEITYSELKSLRDGSQLVPGTWYRITDYTCTCQTDDYDTQVAGHDFDIICLALDESTLSEECHAIQHDGDTYFENSNLNAWKVWYCLDNNKDRFFWADETDGKGVVWRLIDEWDNDVSYDFKNILFLRTIDDVDNYFYTFWKSDDDDNIVDDSLVVSFSEETGCYCNHLFGVNNFDNVFGDNCQYNKFGNYCYSNTFKGDYCGENTFGDYCYSNSFGYDCYSNKFGSGCQSNTFESECRENTFGDSCSSNSFGYDCHSNKFGNHCELNVLERSSQLNTLGNHCSRNILDGESITFGERCSGNAFDSTIGRFVCCHICDFVKDVNFTFTEQRSGTNFEQYCGYNSSGVLKYWIPADLV